MKIFVCLKEVPSRDSRFEVDSSSHWLDERNLSFEISECDEYALEEALRLKEAHGGEVTLLSIGHSRTEKVLRKGLAMGADRAVLVVDDKREVTSPFSLATVLATLLENEPFDLVLAGTQSDDAGYGQTAIMLAGMLDIPHASLGMKIEADPAEGTLRFLHEMESGRFQWLRLPLPTLLGIQAGSSPVRYVSLKGIMQAKKKEIRRTSLGELEVDLSELPALEIQRLHAPKVERKAVIFEGDAATTVDQLVKQLHEEERLF
jgi:electron transfer flavoprotein beta subunit